jgi:HK97 family phage prohead protease
MSTTDIKFKSSAGTFNVDQAQGIVECFVAGIGNKDSVGDVLIPGAFKDSLKRRKPRVVWGHNWNDPIGKVLEIYEVPPSDPRLPMKMKAAGIGGLYARVQFNLGSEKGKEAFANVAFFGEEQEWSIGYKTITGQFDPNLQANILKEVELYEVSPVLHGANQLTGTISVKDGEADDRRISEPNSAMPSVKPKIPSLPENPLMMAIRRELAMRSGSNVIVRSLDSQMVVFDRITSDGNVSMYRCPYHFNGESFMFGQPEKISNNDLPMQATAPEIPPAMEQMLPQTAVYGNSGMNDVMSGMGKSSEEEMFSFFLDDVEKKIGKAISGRNMSKLKNVVQMLQDIIVASEKEVEEKSVYIIEVEPQNAFYTKSLLDPIMDYHRVESVVSEKGIVITSGLTPEFVDAVETLKKGLGARIGGGGGSTTGKVRRAGSALTGNFDPNAIDADGDKIVQEGTAFERPATPHVARDAKKIERGLRSSSNAEVVSKNELPKEVVNDVANAAIRAVGRNGDETRLIDGSKEALANLTNEKLKDSVGTSVSDTRKKLAELLSDEKVIEEFQSPEKIQDFMDEMHYAVQKMLDLHVDSVKKTGTSVEKQEIEDIVDNAKSKFNDDFEKLTSASKNFWDRRRTPGRLDKTPEEAKKESALDRNNLMASIREGGAPEDLAGTLGSIYKLFGDTSEKIISGEISPEDLNYEMERALEQIIENDPSIDPEELVNEFADSLREGASKDSANPLVVSLAKEFGNEKITGGDLIDYLNDTRQDSPYRSDRGKIEKEVIRGLASRGRDDSEYARELKKQREKDRAAGIYATNPIGKQETDKPNEGLQSGRRGEGTMLGRPGQIQRDENGNINSPDAANMRKEHDARIFSKLRELGFNDDEIETLTGVPNGGREHPASEPVGLKSKSIRPDAGIAKYSTKLLKEKIDELNDMPAVGPMGKQLDGKWAEQVISDLNDGRVDPLDMMGVMQIGLDDIHQKMQSGDRNNPIIRERQKLNGRIRRLLVNNMTPEEKNASGKFRNTGLKSSKNIEIPLDGDQRSLLLEEIPMLSEHAKDKKPFDMMEEKLRNAKDDLVTLTPEEHRSISDAVWGAVNDSHERRKIGKGHAIVTTDLGGVLSDHAPEPEQGVAHPGRKLSMKLSQDEIGELLGEIPMLQKHTDDNESLSLIEKKLKNAKNGKVEFTQEEYDAVEKAIGSAIDNSFASDKASGRKKGKERPGYIVTSDLAGVLGQAADDGNGEYVSPNWEEEQSGKRGNLGLRSQGNSGAPKDMTPNEQKFLINWAYQNRGLNIASRIADKHKENDGKLDTADWKALRTLHKRTGGRGLRSEGGSTEASKLMDREVNNLNNRPEIGNASRARGLRSESNVGGDLSAGSLGMSGDGGLNLTPTGEGGGSRKPVKGGRGLGEIAVPSAAGRGRFENNEDPRFVGKKFDEVKPDNWDSKTTEEKLDWMLYDGTPGKSGMRPADHNRIVNELIKQQDVEDAKAERAARRAERASSGPRETVSDVTPPKAEEAVRVEPRPKTEEEAKAARKKDLTTLQKFAGKTADDAIAAHDENNISDTHRESWEDISSILEGSDLHKAQIKEALDKVNSYLKDTADNPEETQQETDLRGKAEQLRTALKTLDKHYSKDEFIAENAPKKNGLKSQSKMPETMKSYVAARDAMPKGLRSERAGRTELKGEATWFRDIEQSMPKEIQAARAAGDKKGAEALGQLQAIISRQEASKIGDRRTNAGRILVTQDEVDSILDGLMGALDRQVESGGEKRQKLYGELLDKLAEAAMGTFIDRSTEELQGRTQQRRNSQGRTVNIQDL